MMRDKKAFTLIELLVVIAIISILAAIIFPVFASVRAKARQTTCASNLKQIGLGLMQYLQDYDETMPFSYYGPGTAGNITPSDPVSYYKWMDAIYPYVKSQQVFTCPSDTESLPYIYRSGVNYGSYGQNGAYKSPVPPPAIPWLLPPRSDASHLIIVSQLAAPSKTVWATDTNNSDQTHPGGKLHSNFGIVWNIPPPADNPTIVNISDGTRQLNQISERHTGMTNVLYCDSHVKSMSLSTLAATKPVVNPNDGLTYQIMTAFVIEDD